MCYNVNRVIIELDNYPPERNVLKTMKKLFASVMLAIMVAVSVPCVSQAAYETSIPITAQGNSSSLIYIKRPRSLSASTSDKTYTISATGVQGTTVRVYKQTPGQNDCALIKSAKQIGASGLYSTVVDLTSSSNTFVVYAENGGNTQVVQIDISKVKQSTVDRLKNVTVNILNFLK